MSYERPLHSHTSRAVNLGELMMDAGDEKHPSKPLELQAGHDYDLADQHEGLRTTADIQGVSHDSFHVHLTMQLSRKISR